MRSKFKIEIALYHEVVILHNWRVRVGIIPIAKIQEQFSSSSAAMAMVRQQEVRKYSLRLLLIKISGRSGNLNHR